jgi:PhzF family phenazine biosynthesis protein
MNITTVDAFTDRPFAGNPAAVCLLDAPADETWMRLVAREMNLSETAFLHPEGAPGTYRLRWFTPAVEVDLCGHATLAAAHLLWEDSHLRPDQPAAFLTRSGRLVAERRGAWIELDFPSLPTEPGDAPAGLLAALGVTPDAVRFCGRSRFDVLVVLGDEAAVGAVRPDFGALARVPARGLIVTAPAAPGRADGADFVSRFFAPAAGVAEDPVTGSAHCVLGPYWAAALGREALVGYQASERGGVVRVRVDGPRTRLAGQAVTMLRGQLRGEPVRAV